MKKILLLGLLFALTVGGCAVTGPYATVKNLKEAAKTGNEQQMTENIDFPLLRQNLKAQVGEMAAVRARLLHGERCLTRNGPSTSSFRR